MTGPLFCTSRHYHKKSKITRFSISKWSFHMNALAENGVGAKFCSCRRFPTDAFCRTTQVYSETSWIEDFNDIGVWGVSTSFNFAKLRNFWTPCRYRVSSRIGWFESSKNRSFFAFFSRAADLQLYLLRQFLSIGLMLAYLHSESFLECK
jgi:hypothetical protein